MQSQHIFTGEDWAPSVIAWLEDEDCLPDDPVRQLRDRADRPWDVHSTITFINDQEREWDFHFDRVASVTPDGPLLKLVHTSNLLITPRNSKMLRAWNHAVLLWSHNLLDRIRPCARPGCGKLFFAKFSHVRFHASECRIATEVSNPEYKKSRREYMRKQRNKKKGKK